MNEKLRFETHADGIAVVTFNRPEAHNALDLDTMHAFAATIQRLHTLPDTRVVILTGAGDQAFCSGGDLTELSQHPSAEAGEAMSRLMGEALLALEQLPCPVIAAINGYALGGGSEIALACDLRIVDEKARLGLVHIKLGLIPGWGAGQRVLRLVGYSRAMEILLRGRPMHVHDLTTLGLVNDVVAAGTALEHALNFARHIAEASPDVVRAIKTLLRAGLHQPYHTALQTEHDLFPALWAAEPHLQAVENFLRSRKQ